MATSQKFLSIAWLFFHFCWSGLVVNKQVFICKTDRSQTRVEKNDATAGASMLLRIKFATQYHYTFRLGRLGATASVYECS
jgi:hypothetical protein